MLLVTQQETIRLQPGIEPDELFGSVAESKIHITYGNKDRKRDREREKKKKKTKTKKQKI